MKDSADRYFELLPVLLIALIMLAAEYRKLAPLAIELGQVPVLERSVFTAPRVIFR
jgi:hypothetical protein